MTALSAADFERAITWNPVIVGELFAKDTPYSDEGKERVWGSLHVCWQTGVFYDFAAATGGINTVRLIRIVKQRLGETWGRTDAERWLGGFLAANPGEGKLEPVDDDLTAARKEGTAALARHYLDTGVPVEPGSLGARYRVSRGLPEIPPEGMGMLWIADARAGEGALIMPLSAFGRTTGATATYVDALGAKSLVLPNRRRLDIEPAPRAAMEIAAPTPGTVDISADVVGCEGWENGESVNLIKSPAWRIIALPGIATLPHLVSALKPEERRVVWFQDSDPEGHPARKGLETGVDALLAAGKQVKTTAYSEAGDANSILQTEGLGEKELRRLIAGAGSSAFSLEGRVAVLATLSESEYMTARREAAKDHKVPVSYFDREVARRRPKRREEDDGSTKPSIILPVNTPWTGPVPRIDQLLDRIVVELRRYVVMQDWQTHLVAVWVALTYFVFDPRIDLQVMPRLAIQSAAINSGKTALLRIVCTLARHGKLYGRATSAGIYRALSQAELTLCLDEVEFLRNDPFSPMMQVLDSSHHREDANILLTEPQAVGPPIARELSTWAAMALACNGQLPGSLQSRSIVVVLLRALAAEEHEFLEKRSTPELVDLRRALTAWGATVTELPLPSRSEMPAEVYNRDADNWRSMFALARLAGGEWLDRIREASLKAVKVETLPPLIVSLLASVKRAFREDPNITSESWVDPQSNTWLDTVEMVARLVGQDGEPWGKINRGGPIDPYWLRTKFLGLLDPAGPQDWWQTFKGGKRKHRSGYFYNQFAEALRRFPEPQAGVFDPDGTHAENPPKMAGVSGAAGENPANPRESAKSATRSAPDPHPIHKADRVHQKSSKSAGDELVTPAAPDPPEDFDGVAACVPEPAARSGTADPVTVSLFITQAQKVALRDRGYSDEQLREMLPATAHEILGLQGSAVDDDPFAWTRTPSVDPGSTIEAAKTAESLGPETPTKVRPTARPRRAKPNGAESTVDSGVELSELARELRSALNADANLEQRIREEHPQLDLPEPSPTAYITGSIADDIRQLRAANPKRSLRWIAQQSGQPPSIVREILGDGEAAP